MFKALYNANRDISKRIEVLNKQYLDLLRNSHIQVAVEFGGSDKVDEAKENIQNKIKKLTEIKQEFEAFCSGHQQLKAEIKEGKEIADSVEKLLDELIESLGIPEETKESFDLNLSSLKIKDPAENQLVS